MPNEEREHNPSHVCLNDRLLGKLEAESASHAKDITELKEMVQTMTEKLGDLCSNQARFNAVLESIHNQLVERKESIAQVSASQLTISESQRSIALCLKEFESKLNSIEVDRTKEHATLADIESKLKTFDVEAVSTLMGAMQKKVHKLEKLRKRMIVIMSILGGLLVTALKFVNFPALLKAIAKWF